MPVDRGPILCAIHHRDRDGLTALQHQHWSGHGQRIRIAVVRSSAHHECVSGFFAIDIRLFTHGQSDRPGGARGGDRGSTRRDTDSITNPNI